MKKILVGTTVSFAALLGVAACNPAHDNPEPPPAQEAPAPEETPEPAPEVQQEEPAPEEETPEPEKVPDPEPQVQQEEAADVPVENFTGTSTEVGSYQVYVNEAYVDEDGYITDGMGLSETAPDGYEYHIFNIQITNNGSVPEYFDSYGTLGYDSGGRTYNNDTGAELTIADDYIYEELNPGASVETDLVFLLPEGTSLTQVDVSGYGTLAP